MEQSTARVGRIGWQPEESEKLFTAVAAANASGSPLRSVFESMSAVLGRKPNSIRNFYYAQLQKQPGVLPARAAAFQTFTQEEIHSLLREVLMARAQGSSVRACVMRLAGGNRSEMLRLQNKYRAVLKTKPDMLSAVAEELRREGLPCPAQPAPERTRQPMALLPPPLQAEQDPAVAKVLEGLGMLLRRAHQPAELQRALDRLQVRYDLACLEWEDRAKLTRDCLDGLMGVCREFLALTAEDKQRQLSAFGESLTASLTFCEEAMTRGEKRVEH